jgi:hypothetical protein
MTEAKQIAAAWLSSFQDACEAISCAPNDLGAVGAVLSHFVLNGWWRDRLCLTWDFRTSEEIAKISCLVTENNALAEAGFVKLELDLSTSLGNLAIQKSPRQDGGMIDTILAPFDFELTNPAGKGRGVVTLVQDSSSQQWKAYILFTALESLKGYEEEVKQPLGHYGSHTLTWDDVHAEELARIESDPTALVVGAGQAGLLAAVRLRKLGIRVLVIEKNPRIGDNWRDRYDLLTLHVSF